MILSFSFSSKTATLFTVLIVLFGCITLKKSEVTSQEGPSSLSVQSLTSDKGSPQVAGVTTVRWTAEARGGVGKLAYEFHSVLEKQPQKDKDGSAEHEKPVVQHRPQEQDITLEQNQYSEAVSPPGPEMPAERREYFTIQASTFLSMGYAENAYALLAETLPENACYFLRIEFIKNKYYAVRVGIFTDNRAAREYLDKYRRQLPGSIILKGYVKTERTKKIYYAPSAAEKDQEKESFLAGPVQDVLGPGTENESESESEAKRSMAMEKEREEMAIADEEHGWEVIEQVGPSPLWEWTPRKAGTYRVKVIVRDLADNTIERSWSSDYKVAPQLVLESLKPEKASPQVVGTTTIRWLAKATGGVGPLTYTFMSFDGKEEVVEQNGTSPVWGWNPGEPGVYKFKTVVTDALGNTVESERSENFRITTKLDRYSFISVFPLQNLSGTVAPLTEIGEALIETLENEGFHVLEENVLEKFMARRRIRYVGGIDGVNARALRKVTGTGAVLITSLELYDEKYPPKIALTSRLVTAKDPPEILWMDSIGLSGDDSPGFLELGLIEDPKELLEKAVKSLSQSLKRTLSATDDTDAGGRKRKKFRPKRYFRSPIMDLEETYTMAVLPFFNRSYRKYAGEIMVLHFVRELVKLKNLRVLEPGVVRKKLLKYRIIMQDGISIDQANIVLATLNADLAFTGKVFDYQDVQGPAGTPVVDFSTHVIEKKSKEVIWASKSYNKGSDGVFFYDWGRNNTANTMASEMARYIGDLLLKK